MGSSSTPTMSDWSTTPGNNDTAGDITFAEGQTPSSLNDSARQLMADVRTWYESPEWIEYGHTPVYVSAGSFTIATDVTSIYHVGRRLKLYGSSMGTVYATITASSYGAPNTTITVARDSGSLGATLSRVWYGALPATNPAHPAKGPTVQTFTSSGTWTRPAGCRRVIVEVVGAGGGGGYAKTTAATQAAAGGGGGAGGYTRKDFSVEAISSATATVGAGGSGGVASTATAATAGGDSTWSDGTNTLTANGGTVGSSDTAGTLTMDTSPGGGGGTSSGGYITLRGGTGGTGFCIGETTGGGTAMAVAGYGGASIYSGMTNQNNAIAGSSAGSAGVGYGGGGGGGCISSTNTNANGGAGADGIVVVTEFY